jgi:SAM-dependent methyltransferase
MRVSATEIQQLFDEKAPSWNAKYLPGGALVGRISRFQDAIEQVCSSPADLLDFGCGTGNIARALATAGYQVAACDASPEMLGRARHPSVAMLTPVLWYEVSTDVPDLPFDDQSFDAIVASSVLEYLTDPLGSLREIRRTLRQGGSLICSVPNPAHRVRRLEGVLRLLAVRPLIALVSPVSDRVASHLRYLRVSRNRMDIDGWSRLAEAAGFTGGLTHLGETRDALLLLELRKSSVAASTPLRAVTSLG